MQLVTLPARLLHWLFPIALSEGVGWVFRLEARGRHLEHSGKELPMGNSQQSWGVDQATPGTGPQSPLRLRTELGLRLLTSQTPLSILSLLSPALQSP